jgi:hypothetical protein
MGGLKFYFSEPFNQFDFVLVTSSIPSTIANIAGTEPFVNLSMLRVMKMLRMLKLLRKTRALILVVARAQKPMGNLMLFMAFTLSLFAIFGMNMFAGIICEEDLVNDTCPSYDYPTTPRTNMNTFPAALFALYQVMTGEDWNSIMYYIMKVPGQEIFGLVFMCSFFILANYILMEMFCAVILENFQLRTAEKFMLQQQLLDVKRAKAKAAQELAAGVDKKLAEIKAKEQEEKDKKEREDRERKIREKKEAERLGRPVDEEEETVAKTPEQIEKENKLKAMQEEERRQQVQAELRAQQSEIEIPEGGDGYDTKGPGSSDNIILDAVQEGKKVKKKKDTGPPQVVVAKTCFVFSQDNNFREWCYFAENHPAFDTIMFTTICIGSVMLALDTAYKSTPFMQDMIAIADPIILGIFSVEFCIRVVSRGFSGKPSAYISDDWNKLDFFVLAFSYFCILVRDIPGGIARAVRIGRAIRPLRMINQNERIQIVFNALFMAMPDIANVIFLAVFVIFMFSVMGLGFFMGMFYSCNMWELTIEYDAAKNMDACVGIFESETEAGDAFMVPAVWSNPSYNFDDVFAGILTLYEVSSLEGWLDPLYSTMDITELNVQPVVNYSSGLFWYICLYIAVLPFFILNLTVGVIIEKFNQISGRGLLTQEQRMFKDTLLQAMLHDSTKPLDRPEGYVRGVCYAIVTNPNFETMILFLVVSNSVVMAATHYEQPESFSNMQNMLNFMFTAIFTIECAVKLTGVGFSYYFADGWNCLDFSVVIGSLVMIPLDGLVNLQALRPFRLLIIFRMIRRARGIRLMVSTLLLSLPALFNVTCLLGLAFFIYAVLGMTLFGNVKFGSELNYNANFRYFDDSLLLLCRMVTGEAWNSIMHDCSVSPPDCTNFAGQTYNGWGDDSVTDPRALDGYWLPNDCGSSFAATTYFITFQIVGNYMVLNLFVAVILDNYAYMANVGDAELNLFVLEKFKKTWYRFTMKDPHAARHLGQNIRTNKLREFLDALGSPLGIVLWDKKGTEKYKKIKEEIRRVEVPGVGASYRAVQYILCLHAMAEDPACDMPVEEKVERQELLHKMVLEQSASKLQAIYRGVKGRKNLGVTKGAAKSESEMKAASFKKRFVGLMNNPGAMTAPKVPAKAMVPAITASATTSASPLAAGQPGNGAALSTAMAVPQGIGVPPNSPPTAGTEAATAAAVDATKNIFKERAAQRAAAKAKKTTQI